MLFRNTILYSHDTFTNEAVYNVLFSNEKMKHLVKFEAQRESLVGHGGYERRRLKFNFSNQIFNYCKKK